MTSPSHIQEKDLKDNEHLEILADNEVALTPEQTDFLKKESRVRRKLDLYITPIMLLLQLISYLDRGNIGFAATQGMTKEIGLKGNQLNMGSLVQTEMIRVRTEPARSPCLFSTSFTSWLNSLPRCL